MVETELKAEKSVLKPISISERLTVFTTAQEPKRGVIIDVLADKYTKVGDELQYLPIPLARLRQSCVIGYLKGHSLRILNTTLFSRTSEFY